MATKMTEDDTGVIEVESAHLDVSEGQASEAFPMDLDMQATLPTQIAIKKHRRQYIKPINAIDRSNQIQFRVQSSLQELIVPQDCYLEIICSITNPDGNAYPLQANNAYNPQNNVIPVNNVANSIFKNIHIKINDTPLQGGTDNMYPYRVDFETRLMQPQHVKKGSNLRLTGFLEEEASYDAVHGNLNFAQADEHAVPPAENWQLHKRYLWGKAGKRMYFATSLHSEIFDQPKPLPPNTEMFITFERTDNDHFPLMTPRGNDNYKISLHSARMSVRYITLDEEILAGMIESMKKEPALFPLRYVKMSYFTKLQNTSDFSEVNILKGSSTLPRRIFAAVVRQDAFNGSKARDPFTYPDIAFKRVSLKVGGQYEPLEELEINRTEQVDYLQQCMALQEATGSMWDEGLGIHPDNIGNRSMFWAWDLTPSKVPPGQLYELPNNKTLDLDMHIDVPLQETYTLIVYKEYDAEIEIDEVGKVSMKTFGA